MYERITKEMTEEKYPRTAEQCRTEQLPCELEQKEIVKLEEELLG